MAIAAGGKSWLDKSSLMEYPMNPQIGRDSSAISRIPQSVWVNENAVRFADENCSATVPARAALAVRAQDVSYAVFNQEILDAAIANEEGADSMVEDGISNGFIFRADSIAELADAAGLDAEALQATIDQYNSYCEAGSDDEFGKDASCLVAIENGPFYLSQNNGIYFLTTIGGIDTTERCEVRAEAGGVIRGLYAVGVDGVQLYNGLYTIDIPGSCNANNVHTGRVAAQQALALL